MLTTEKIFIQPKTVEDALEAAYNHIENFKYVAGGTDVFVNKYQGNETSGCLIDITGISELRAVTSNIREFNVRILCVRDVHLLRCRSSRRAREREQRKRESH